MSAYRCLVGATARWAGMAPQRADELVADVCDVAERSLLARSRELGSVAAMCIGMRARRSTGGDGLRALRQGASFGAAVAAILAAPMVVTSLTLHPAALFAFAATYVAMVGAVHSELVRGVTASASGALLVVMLATSGAPTIVVSLVFVAHAGLLVGEPPAARRPSIATAAGTAVALTGAGALGTLVSSSLLVNAALWSTVLFPVALMVLGRLDVRLAAAATVLVFARFGTLDRSDLVALVDGTDLASASAVMGRLVLMSSFIAVGALATRSGLRHSATL